MKKFDKISRAPLVMSGRVIKGPIGVNVSLKVEKTLFRVPKMDCPSEELLYEKLDLGKLLRKRSCKTNNTPESIPNGNSGP